MCTSGFSVRCVRTAVVILTIAGTLAAQDSRAAQVADEVADFVTNLASPNVLIRDAAHYALAGRGELAREAATQLAKVLGPPRDEAWCRRASGVGWLGFGLRQRADAQLATGAKPEDAKSRALADDLAFAYGVLAPVLREALADPVVSVRGEAIRDLSWFGPMPDSPLRDLPVWTESCPAGMEADLLVGLWQTQCADPRVVPFVEACLKSPEGGLRRDAAVVAARLGAHAAPLVPRLTVLVANTAETAETRSHAAAALRAVGASARAVAHQHGRGKEPSPPVSAGARRCVRAGAGRHRALALERARAGSAA